MYKTINILYLFLDYTSMTLATCRVSKNKSFPNVQAVTVALVLRVQTERLRREESLRQAEGRALQEERDRLQEETARLQTRVDELRDELPTQKRKQAANLKDLTKQLTQGQDGTPQNPLKGTAMSKTDWSRPIQPQTKPFRSSLGLEKAARRQLNSPRKVTHIRA